MPIDMPGPADIARIMKDKQRVAEIKQQRDDLAWTLMPFVLAYKHARENGEKWYGALDRISEENLRAAENALLKIWKVLEKDDESV